VSAGRLHPRSVGRRLAAAGGGRRA
jgi:hypothetical protein